MIKTLAKQIKQYKLPSILTVAFASLEVVMEIIIPLLMAQIIDRGFNADNLHAVYLYGLLMFLSAGVSLTCGILAGRFAAKASSGYACNLRNSMYENIQTFSFANIDKYSTAGLVTRMTTDVTNVQNAYQMILRMCVRSPLMLVCAFAMTVVISPRISMIYLVAIVFLGTILFVIIKTTMPVFEEVFKKYDELNASVQENVSSIRVVKAYVREDYERGKFEKAITNVYRLFVKAESHLAFHYPAMMLTMYGCILGVSWVGAKLIVGGSMTTGELTSLFTYTMNILMALMMLSMIFVMLTISLASCRRIAGVLNEQADLVNPKQPVMTVKDGRVDFEQVCFSYKKEQKKSVLSDIDFHVRSGETIGIIGSTGSAKSSLVNLISRLYDVNRGSVKVGGIDVRRYDLTTLRNQVAVVLQKNELFSGTILDNLRWGNEQATLEECVEACRQACADQFICQFPQKYDTYIEQGGSNVSGGQKQRLCIARALLKHPKVLILDDSTSAVDTATEANIRRAFRESIPDTTKFIIAQRISSIQDADRTIVLEDGRIHGLGTHEELMRDNEIYRSIYEGQTQGGGDFDEKGA